MKKTGLLLIFLLLLSACTGKQREADNGPLKVVASTTIIADVVSQIGGDRIELNCLLDPAEDPHSYQPVSADMALVEKADIIFINGFGLEENLLTVLDNIAKGEIIEVSSDVRPVKHDQDDHDENDEFEHETEEYGHDHAVDPHTWMSPRNVMLWLPVIEQALAEADPDNSAYYAEQSADYAKKLVEADNDIVELFSEIPAEERIVITDHRTMDYFARDYGLTVLATIIPSSSTNAEISSREMAELIGLLKRQDVSVVLVSDTAGPSLLQLTDLLAEDSGKELIITPVMTAALSREGLGSDYLGLIFYNSSVIAEALKGGPETEGDYPEQ